jgi:glycosyltransferase involved in cell wall biosynthesis
MMSFDIIIPTFNNLNELKSCLDGLSKQTCGSFRAIICVDGSTDGTVEYLAGAGARYLVPITVVEHPDRRNHGRNPARNLALPYLENEYLLLLDSDAVPAPDLLDVHLSLLRKQECVSIGGFFFTNTETNIWARYLATRGRNRMRPGASVPYHKFNSMNAAFHTRYFKELHGQDPAMTHYGAGDTEFAIRLFDRYHPVFIKNTAAAVYSEMHREIDAGMDIMRELGRFNLPYIYERHPAHRNLYGMSLMKKYPLFFRIACNTPMLRLIRRMINPDRPSALQLVFVRYLVVANVFRGFSSR